ncbi:type II toxin-antitoxin system mRNA interferase toxin, RelE/StbE family [Candidatus Shapirobacteria bacterium]|nr:type II toxin-antitoxin system mRNA interferase toxin, RelE/StbE family [Candidatus Shapirobacteria bacterium]
MRVEYHRQFLKNFRKRVLPYPKLRVKFEERLKMRLNQPESFLLKDHQLLGKKAGYRAFSLSGEMRVVYKIEGDVFRLYDVGSHNQVY